MRKVLVIAYYFPPMGLSGVQRTLKFVKYLSQFGWQPIVLTCNPGSYYAFDESLEDDLKDAIVYRTDDDGLKGKTKKTIPFPNYTWQKLKRNIVQTIFQPDSRILWKKHAIKKAEQIIKEHDIDVIYATAPPFTDFLVAEEISEKYNIPFVVDYRDLWVDNEYYYYATHFHKQYAMDLESKVINKARRIIVISRFMTAALLKRYKILKFQDISVIPHGFDREDMQVDFFNYKNRDKLVITHSGVFSDDLTPKYFLKALSNLLKKNKELAHKIEARFIGVMRKSHIKYIKRYKLENVVSVYGYLPHKETIKHLLASDVLWMMLPNNNCTPSRLYEYIGTRKPILYCGPKGDMTTLVEDSKAGFIVKHDNPKEISQKLKEIVELRFANKLSAIPEDYANRFDRLLLTEQLSKELNSCVVANEI